MIKSNFFVLLCSCKRGIIIVYFKDSAKVCETVNIRIGAGK